MGFSRQEHCSGSPFPSPGDQTQVSRIAGRSFTTWATGEAVDQHTNGSSFSTAFLPRPASHSLMKRMKVASMLFLPSHPSAENRDVQRVYFPRTRGSLECVKMQNGQKGWASCLPLQISSPPFTLFLALGDGLGQVTSAQHVGALAWHWIQLKRTCSERPKGESRMNPGLFSPCLPPCKISSGIFWPKVMACLKAPVPQGPYPTAPSLPPAPMPLASPVGLWLTKLWPHQSFQTGCITLKQDSVKHLECFAFCLWD